MDNDEFCTWHGEVMAMIAEGVPVNRILAKVQAVATTPHDVANYLRHLQFSALCLEQDVSGSGVVVMQGQTYDLDAVAASSRPTLARLHEVIAKLQAERGAHQMIPARKAAMLLACLAAALVAFVAFWWIVP